MITNFNISQGLRLGFFLTIGLFLLWCRCMYLLISAHNLWSIAQTSGNSVNFQGIRRGAVPDDQILHIMKNPLCQGAVLRRDCSWINTVSLVSSWPCREHSYILQTYGLFMEENSQPTVFLKIPYVCGRFAIRL